MMEIRGRTFLAAITASAFILLSTASSHSSSSPEAERKYAVARERLADLKRSPKRMKYRSYWMDSVRLFEAIEEKYPASPVAADACFERGYVFFDLFRFNRALKDAKAAGKTFAECRKRHPRHPRAAEALYRIAMIERDIDRDRSAAVEAYRTLAAEHPDSIWTEKARVQLGIRNGGKNGNTPKAAEIRKPPETVITAPKGPPGTVTNVRYWSGGNYTRIVIDQDKPLRFKANELKNPDRLVFDILNSRLSDSVEKDPLPVNDGILRQVRTSQYAPDTVRVVLDLASLKSYAAFPLRDPERLVIDVTGEAAEDGGEPSVASPPGGTPAEPQHQQERPAAPETPRTARPEPRGDGKLSLSRQMGLKIRTIAIDAGHGGHDPGAIGRGGLREKDVTLDVARRLAAMVKERLDCKVVMTRNDDVFVDLDKRPWMAKEKGADLFVSIHVNASRKQRARGIETYIQGLRASDKEAMATAARENAMTGKTLNDLDDELTKILKGLSKSDDDEESVYLANYVQTSLVDSMRPVSGHIVNLGVKRAFFYVLVNTQMPSILAEVGFISNPAEEKLLRKDSYRQAIAEALFKGVKKYVESRVPQTTAEL